MKKEIVIISHLIFPANTPRANRATELAKGFAKAGHDVTIYAVIGEYDYSEFERTNGVKVKPLGKMFFSNQTSDVKNNTDSKWQKGLAVLFNKFLEVPDIELAFSTKKIIKKFTKSPDLLITIGFPYPIHWGAALAQKRAKFFPKTWVTDCGDPYMGNVNITRPFYFKYIEKWFCKKVDAITVPIESAISGYYPEFTNKIHVIPQGFDFTNNKLEADSYIPNTVPTFIYAGAFYPKIRDPRLFLDFLTTIKREFKFIIYTKNRKLVEPYLEKLGQRLEIYDYIDRNNLLLILSKADFLVNFENLSENQQPSKLIDYYIAKRPILSIKDEQSFDTFIEFLDKDYRGRMEDSDIEKYNIKNIINQFLKLIK